MAQTAAHLVDRVIPPVPDRCFPGGNEAADVLVILRSPRQGFHDEEIFEGGDRYRHASHVYGGGPADGILFEARHADRHIESNPGPTVPQRKDERRLHHLLHIGEQRSEGRVLERLQESQSCIDVSLDHEIDIDRHSRLPAKRHRQAADHSERYPSGLEHRGCVNERLLKG
jgi:hypothetical protein